MELAIRHGMLPVRLVTGAVTRLGVAIAKAGPEAGMTPYDALGADDRAAISAAIGATIVPTVIDDAALIWTGLREAYGLAAPEDSAVAHIPQSVAFREHVLPYRIVDGTLYVGALDASDGEALVGRLRGTAKLPIVVFPLARKELLDGHRQWYRYTGDETATLSSAGRDGVEAVRKGVRLHAEDVHFETSPSGGFIRLAIGGRLVVLKEYKSVDEFARVIHAMRAGANLDAGNDQETIAGDREFLIDGRRIETRCVYSPTAFGGQLVVRIHDTAIAPKKYRDTGIKRKLAHIIRNAIRYRPGIVCVVGPPASGKNALVYAILADLPLAQMKVCTAERSLERWMPHVQHQLVNATNTYAKILGHHLELGAQLIYSAETLEEMAAAALAAVGNFGRTVITTLHTADSKGCIQRLGQLGVAPHVLGEYLNMVVASRLLRRICRDCSTEVAAPEWLQKKRPDIRGKIRAAAAGGCDICEHSGYVGKTGVYEVLVVTDAMRRAIIEGRSSLEIEQMALAADFGFRPLLEDALDLVADGTTSLEEAIAATSLGDDFLQRDDDGTWWDG